MSLTLLLSSLSMSAQSSGDKLFIEGQRLQQKLTVESQTMAIKKFKAAKVVYTVADKKTMCDNQIAICSRNISTIKSGKSTRNSSHKSGKSARSSKSKSVAPEVDSVEEVKPEVINVELSLSESRLDFKSKPKEDFVEIVTVNSNRPDDVEISSKPDWVTADLAKGKLFIGVQSNESTDERSGVVRVKCINKEVDLVVNQAKVSSLRAIGKMFKKKKK